MHIYNLLMNTQYNIIYELKQINSVLCVLDIKEKCIYYLQWKQEKKGDANEYMVKRVLLSLGFGFDLVLHLKAEFAHVLQEF